MDGGKSGEEWRDKLAATPKEGTAKSGCATKDQDAGLPGKSDRDAESAKARRYVAREAGGRRRALKHNGPSMFLQKIRQQPVDGQTLRYVTTALESRK